MLAAFRFPESRGFLVFWLGQQFFQVYQARVIQDALHRTLADQVKEELNVKELRTVSASSDLVDIAIHHVQSIGNRAD